jgi:hypothetical protein
MLAKSPLAALIEKAQFVGWVYAIDYESAMVLTNDLFKKRARGIPHNCFLTAAAFDPDRLSAADDVDREVILLRVVGVGQLPQDRDDLRTKIDHLMRQESPDNERDYDDITLSQLQFGGLHCRVLGTFYLSGAGELRLGSDIESFYASTHLKVYRPVDKALRTIVNHVDPIRQRDAEAIARDLGLTKMIEPIRLGTVRYTSTDRLHRGDPATLVPVYIQPMDFLARRTALFGMTRTGKSNAVKQIVSVVKRVADDGGLGIGQVIFDITGEYANANQQDRGALAEVYPDEQVVRYRLVDTPGFRPLQNNFYLQVSDGHRIIARVIRESGEAATDVKTFAEASFDEPDESERGLHNRWKLRVAAYQALLFRAEFPPPKDFRVKFEVNANVRAAVQAVDSACSKDPRSGLTLQEAVRWFLAARQANLQAPFTSTGSGEPLFDQTMEATLNMLAQQSKSGTFIKGFRVLIPARKYHSPSRGPAEVGDEIYQELTAGRIVIVDLSVGDEETRRRLTEDLGKVIFRRSLETFIEAKRPPEIMLYIEEAHNLIGKDADLDETWPKIAKEGAKYRLGLVYATQEVSSMHPNILANTENWIITHLNNQNEVRKLAAYYDFRDFDRSLIHAQDVGFARVKTLSGPYVIPVQIDRFDADQERQRARAALEASRRDELDERPVAAN